MDRSIVRPWGVTCFRYELQYDIDPFIEEVVELYSYNSDIPNMNILINDVNILNKNSIYISDKRKFIISIVPEFYHFYYEYFASFL
jgi:hypothetical protein